MTETMTALRITAVDDARAFGDWIIRGEQLPSKESFYAHTKSRSVAALCLGARIMRDPVTVVQNADGDIIAASCL